jgi:hypothetical protein
MVENVALKRLHMHMMHDFSIVALFLKLYERIMQRAGPRSTVDTPG